MINLHQEVDDIPALTASETVEVTLRWGYMKGRTLLVVKWAETFLLSPASAFELYEVANDIIDRAVLSDVCNVLISNATSHSGYLRLLSLACSA